jgi:hypothetical protein
MPASLESGLLLDVDPILLYFTKSQCVVILFVFSQLIFNLHVCYWFSFRHFGNRFWHYILPLENV